MITEQIGKDKIGDRLDRAKRLGAKEGKIALDEGQLEIVEEVKATGKRKPMEATFGETSGNGIKINGQAIESKKGSPDAPKWLIEGVQKIENKAGVPAMVSKKLEAYLLKNNVSQADINKMTPEQALRTAGEISGIIEKNKEKTKVVVRTKEEEPAHKIEKLTEQDKNFLRHQVNFWEAGNMTARLPKFEDLLIKAGVSQGKVVKMSVGELIEETKKIVGWEKKEQTKKIEAIKNKEASPRKDEYLAKARAEYVKRLLSQGYDEDQINRVVNSPKGKEIIKDIMMERRKKEADVKKETPEQIGLKQEQGDEATEKRDEDTFGDEDYAESLRKEMEKKTEEIHKKLNEVYEKEISKPKTGFEEFEGTLKQMSGFFRGEELYRLYRDAYLNKLGWEIRYTFMRNSAYLVDRATGKAIAEDGSLIEEKNKTAKRKEFKTEWQFPNPETPLVKFLREQTKNQFEKGDVKVGGEKTPEQILGKMQDKEFLAKVQKAMEEYGLGETKEKKLESSVFGKIRDWSKKVIYKIEKFLNREKKF